jgi:hypothetical protein
VSEREREGGREREAEPQNVLYLQVEIVMRVLRQWTPEDDEILDPEAVKLADLTIKVNNSLEFAGQGSYYSRTVNLCCVLIAERLADFAVRVKVRGRDVKIEKKEEKEEHDTLLMAQFVWQGAYCCSHANCVNMLRA